MILCNQCGAPLGEGATVCEQCRAPSFGSEGVTRQRAPQPPNSASAASVERGGDIWDCLQCGEQIVDDLDVCWNCQTPKDGSQPESYFTRVEVTKEFAALQEKMSTLENSDLLRIVNFDSKDYREEALDLARAELAKRGLPQLQRPHQQRVQGRSPNPTIVDEIEREFWMSIKNSDDVQDFREYIENYPNGIYAVIARNRLRKLEAGGKSAPPPATSSRRQGSSIITNQFGIDLIWISPGGFMMGSENGEPDERPVHQVSIGAGFYIGRCEVTQSQWQTLIGSNPSSFKGDKLPVENVSWNDVQQFVQRLNQTNDGFTYALPTEAEWEYACRAGTTGDYAGHLDSMAWYASNSGNQTHPVGTKQPNAWGLFDMHGNVSEWCHDFYDENYYRVSPGDDPEGVAIGEYRVLRGGSWDMDGTLARSATRYRNTPDHRDGSSGFRVVAVRRMPTA